MKKGQRTQKNSIGQLVVTGIVITLAVSLLMSAIFAAVLMNGALDENNITYIVPLIQLLSVLIGGLYGGKRFGQKYIVITSAIGGGYCLILIISTLLFWGSSFGRIGMGIIMCTLGIIASNIVCLINKPRNKLKKHRL